MLDMKTTCGRCDATLTDDGAASICSYECTFCPGCTAELDGACANCGGELVARPKRASGG